MPHLSLFPKVPGGTHLHLTQHVPHALKHTLGLECKLHLYLHNPPQSNGLGGGAGAGARAISPLFKYFATFKTATTIINMNIYI